MAYREICLHCTAFCVICKPETQIDDPWKEGEERKIKKTALSSEEHSRHKKKKKTRGGHRSFLCRFWVVCFPFLLSLLCFKTTHTYRLYISIIKGTKKKRKKTNSQEWYSFPRPVHFSGCQPTPCRSNRPLRVGAGYATIPPKLSPPLFLYHPSQFILCNRNLRFLVFPVSWRTGTP